MMAIVPLLGQKLIILFQFDVIIHEVIIDGTLLKKIRKSKSIIQ